MRAVRYDAFGHPNDVLELRSDVPVPQCGKNDVLVEVQAAALNPVDYKILKGNFKMVKALMTPAPGFDFAGRVVAVGTHCKRLAVGDLVHGMCSFRRTGTLSEFIAVPEKVAAKRPESLGLYDAAGLPLAGLTAYCSLSKYLRPESRVLVLGGASATGSAALQVARMFKAGFVATTCSPRSEEYVKSLGADMTVNYREENVWTVMQEKALQFDVIFDTIDDAVPGDTYRGAVPGGVLANGGHLVTITGDQQGHFSLGEVMKRGWQLTARNFECKTKHKGAGSVPRFTCCWREVHVPALLCALIQS